MTQPGTVQSTEPPEDVSPLMGAPAAAGQQDQPMQDDYFGFGGTETFYFPDKVTFVQFRKMNEGAKARYEARTQGDFELDRRSGNAKVRVDPAKQRHEMIRSSVEGWNLVSGGQPVPFTVPNLERWLSVADPAIVADLAKAIEKANPFMRSDVTSKDIREEIAHLEEQLREVEAREQGEAS